MIIDHKLNLIFIAVPKTGSTSMHSFLKNFISEDTMYLMSTWKGYELTKHSKALTIKNKIENYESYHKFAVVRNPYDWCVSWYISSKRNNPGRTFVEFLKEFKEIVEVEQLDRLTDENGKIIVDTIIRYENLETEFLSLLDKLNINYNVDHFFLRGVDGLSRENVSSDSFKFYFHPPGNKDYRELYNTDTKNLVEEYQMKTIKHFNYKF
jgi:hypothetical protein